MREVKGKAFVFECLLVCTPPVSMHTIGYFSNSYVHGVRTTVAAGEQEAEESIAVLNNSESPSLASSLSGVSRYGNDEMGLVYSNKENDQQH